MLQKNVEGWIDRIRTCFTDTILRRGWKYYLDNAVTSLSVKETKIQAIVAGTNPYRVTIDLTSFSTSFCSCPYGGYCKHMAAVLFEVLDETGSEPSLLLPSKMKSSVENKPNIAYLSTKTNQNLQVPKETDSIAEWHQFFTETVELPAFVGSHSMLSFYSEFGKRLFSYCQMWNDDQLRWFYRLHAWLFLMKRIEVIFQQIKNQYSYYDNFNYYQDQVQQCMPDLVQIVTNLDDQEMMEPYSSYFLDTIHFVAENAFPIYKTVVDWSRIYYHLWDNMLFYEPWLQAESIRLRTELHRPVSFEIRNEALVKALIHLEVLRGNDKQAMEVADQEFSSLDMHTLLPDLRVFEESGQWERLVKWLRWLRPKMKDVGTTFMNQYLDMWRKLEEQNRLASTEWEEILLSFLPHSYRMYAEYLIIEQRYRDWADLHLFYGTSPEQLLSADVKEVEAYDLPSLLPLYHQAAERHILDRNRDSYKQAVKLLKKLRKFYRSLKEQPRWTLYIESLSAKYKRLRAFQEELQKGKLIP